MNDFETVPAGTMKELEKVKEDRDNMAAHVEELETMLEGAQLGLRWFRDEHPDEDTEADAEFDTQMTAALQGSPTTSLSRLKAECQAEAYDFSARLAKLMGADDARLMGFSKEISAFLESIASDLRRQAEGGDS